MAEQKFAYCGPKNLVVRVGDATLTAFHLGIGTRFEVLYSPDSRLY